MKQYSIWAHPRSGSTWLCNIFNYHAEKNYRECYHMVTPSEFLLRKPAEISRNKWNTYKTHDVYAIWKIISPYSDYSIDLSEVLACTISLASGRKNWKHTVISWLKAKQTGIWNSRTLVTDLPKFNIDLVTNDDVFHIFSLISTWYHNTKELNLPVVWYENLTFTENDLEIFKFNFNKNHVRFDNTLVKKISNEEDYVQFEAVESRFDITAIIEKTKFPKTLDDLSTYENDFKWSNS